MTGDRTLRRALTLVRRAEVASGMGGPVRRPMASAGRFAWRGEPPRAMVPTAVRSARTSEVAGVRADVVASGRLGGELVRARAFYPGPEATTLTVHQRRWRRGRPVPARLSTGAQVQARWAEAREPGLVVPRVRATGGGPGSTWVLEDLVPGRPPKGREWSGLCHRYLPAVVRVHLRLGVWGQRAGVVVRDDAPRRFEAALACSGSVVELALEGSGRTTTTLGEQVTRLLRDDPVMLMGWCHGDPVPGNTLVQDDGTVVLVDWELAGRRPVAHDVVKAVLGTRDALEQIRTWGQVTADTRIGRQAAGWPEQASVALVSQMLHWERQHAVAAASGRADHFAVRATRQVRLLVALLDAR